MNHFMSSCVVYFAHPPTAPTPPPPEPIIVEQPNMITNILFPRDVWLVVFEDNAGLVLSQRDICAIIRTCKPFYELANRLLYKHIVWTNARHFVQSFSVWTTGSPIWHLPRSLVVSINEVRVTSPARLVDVDGKSFSITSGQTDRNLADALRLQSANIESGVTFAAYSLYRSIPQLACSFSKLNSLTFRSAVIPPVWHPILHELPSLRKLHFEECVLSEALHYIDHSTLPITELCLRNVTRRAYVQNPTPDMTGVRSLDRLVSSPSIRHLQIDVTTIPFLLWTSTNRKGIPSGLQSLWIHDGSTLNIHAYMEFQVRVAHLLYYCHNITTFATSYNMISISSMRRGPTYVRDRISNYRGSIGFLLSSRFDYQSLEALDLYDTAADMWEDVINVVSYKFPNVRILTLNLGCGWREGIMKRLAIMAQIPHPRLQRLVRLKIVYTGDPIHDQYIMGMSASVSRLTSLKSFQLYRRSTPSVIAESPVNVNYQDPNDPTYRWDLYPGCQNLRELQLVDGYIWRRSSVGDRWVAREVPGAFDSWNESVL